MIDFFIKRIIKSLFYSAVLKQKIPCRRGQRICFSEIVKVIFYPEQPLRCRCSAVLRFPCRG